MSNKVGDTCKGIMIHSSMQGIWSSFIFWYACICGLLYSGQNTAFTQNLGWTEMIIAKHCWFGIMLGSYLLKDLSLPSLNLLAEATEFWGWNILILSRIHDAINLHKSSCTSYKTAPKINESVGIRCFSLYFLREKCFHWKM